MKNCLYYLSIFAAAFAVCSSAHATVLGPLETVDFRVDFNALDTNNDQFVTGDEFTLTGSDGTTFVVRPVNNLVGFPRITGSQNSGVRIGGGGGSLLEFSLTTDRDILLVEYVLTDVFGFLGNVDFDILDGTTLLSEDNAGNPRDATLAFNDGPVTLFAGTTYTFDVNNVGAASQSFLQEFRFAPVPEPSAALASLAFIATLTQRQRRSVRCCNPR